ncbi:TPA: hypothetical protein VDV84_004492 [Pseudomonas aeruginosa]|jgi:hypothetical protein|uniref:hypothetical protein n=1 Tax=Pseudomonas TaxID=286 RepID=UPI000F53CAE6|nr:MULTISPECIES: hypothetical protein [Pseudomonas]DAL10628.1 MAG TPA_asm: Lon protease (S16) C-terminal proteolytic domain [Caudoviricetes sp.]EIU2646248.1 hypothetical protein [Pseudomonas aeruginosa]EIU2686196.1 hypothetical protein [Pseudomonas aeruginosa]EIU3125155.1 hypothetical protein [Pseudomonas aeruginosa]EIU5418317.1 hypothetical protein [Pseudomonas aeruginosa]
MAEIGLVKLSLFLCLILVWSLHRAHRKTMGDIRRMKESVEAFEAYREALRSRASKEVARGVTLFEKADSHIHLESSFSKDACATKTTSAIAACSSPAAYSG